MKERKSTTVILLALLQFVLGIALILGAALVEQQNWSLLFYATLRDLGLLLSTTGIISLLYDRLLRREMINEVVQQVNRISNPSVEYGLATFYPSRTAGLPTIGAQLAQARKEFFAVGLSLGTIIEGYRDQLEQKAMEGCSIMLLMMNPTANGEDPNPLIDRMTANLNYQPGEYAKELNRRIDAIKKWKLKLEETNPKAAEKIQLKVYNSVPTMALLMIDANTELGKIVVELYPFKRFATQRPGFELRYSGRECLYRQFHDSYKQLWDESKALVPCTSHSTNVPPSDSSLD